MSNVHIQRPTNTPLYTGLFEMIEVLENKFDMKQKTMIEIGSYQGESTEVFAKLFNKIYAIDPWINGYDPYDISSHATEMSLVEKAFDDRMKFYNGLFKIKDKSTNFFNNFNQIVDFTYIDGDHRYEAVIEDIKLASKVSRYIGGHDYGMESINRSLKEFLNTDELNSTNIYVFSDSSWIINRKLL
jgi:hypothetical protein